MQNEITVRQIQLEGNAMFRFWTLKEIGAILLLISRKKQESICITTIRVVLTSNICQCKLICPLLKFSKFQALGIILNNLICGIFPLSRVKNNYNNLLMHYDLGTGSVPTFRLELWSTPTLLCLTGKATLRMQYTIIGTLEICQRYYVQENKFI
jgi:hypothetical protein